MGFYNGTWVNCVSIFRNDIKPITPRFMWSMAKLNLRDFINYQAS